VFSKGIHETALTSEVADRLFSNITESNTLDKSFLATLRALLRNRLPKDETVRVICQRYQFSDTATSAVSASERTNIYVPETATHLSSSEHSIHIVYTETQDAGATMIETIKASAAADGSHIKHYQRRDDLHVFYARKAKALFYTDVSGKNTIIFIEKLELKHFHALQMMITKYLPQLFAATPLTETEVALLKSTGNKSACEYEQLIEELAKDLDLRSEIIRTKLTGFETTHERNRLDEVRNEIGSYQAEYERQLSLLREINNKIEERMYTLAGLECSINRQSEDSELMEYFICNKKLTLIHAAGTSIEFIVHGYADIYDEDAFEKYVSNHDGYLYSGLSSSVTKEQMEKLYRAIFSEGKYRLRLCAAYRADIRNRLIPLKNYSFPSESGTYLPNPHIQSHGCIGGYEGRFQEYMQNKDYVGGINQAVVSAGNLNFHDSTVISKLASKLSSASVKCLEKSDGTLLSPREAINELEGV